MKTKEYKITQFIAHFVLILFTVMAAAPFILLVMSSFTDESWAIANGYSFFPGKFSLDAYRFISYQSSDIMRAYLMTIASTTVGTSLSLCISILYAYGICQTHVPGMKVISFLLILTMLLNGGIVSTYYCYVKWYQIKDTFWALIIPNLLMSPFEVILLRNYFRTSIPNSLLEAARLDRATEFGILYRVVLPLSKPIIATIALMRGLVYWNDWINGLYYLSARKGKKYYTIQVIMNNMVESIESLRETIGSGLTSGKAILAMPSATVRMALAAIGVLPILLIYPFFQRYFVKGITLGGVKE